MSSRPRIRVAALVSAVTVAVAGVVSGPAVAHVDAPSPRASESAAASLEMPGRAIRAKGDVVVSAIDALGFLMRTENVENPTYRVLRQRVAAAVARRLGADSARFDRAWAKAPRDHQLAVLAALTQLGVRYVEGKEDPHVSMDCSGLLWFAWRVAGVDMPRVSVSQLDSRMLISGGNAVAGDIAGEGTHVHMYLGVERYFVHAPFSGKRVTLKVMKKSQWARVAWTNPSNIATYRL